MILITCGRKELISVLQKERPQLSGVKLEQKPELLLSQKITLFEEKFKVHRYKFGVLFAKDSQQKENEIYSTGNEILLEITLILTAETSPAFEEFLDLIGSRIRLLNWNGYAGGLNTKGLRGHWQNDHTVCGLQQKL
jgi:hypothetical protein